MNYCVGGHTGRAFLRSGISNRTYAHLLFELFSSSVYMQVKGATIYPAAQGRKLTHPITDHALSILSLTDYLISLTSTQNP